MSNMVNIFSCNLARDLLEHYYSLKLQKVNSHLEKSCHLLMWPVVYLFVTELSCSFGDQPTSSSGGLTYRYDDRRSSLEGKYRGFISCLGLSPLWVVKS